MLCDECAKTDVFLGTFSTYSNIPKHDVFVIFVFVLLGPPFNLMVGSKIKKKNIYIYI